MRECDGVGFGSVWFGSTCAVVRRGSGSVRFQFCAVLGLVRVGSVRFHVRGRFGSVRVQVWPGSVRVRSHQLYFQFGPVRLSIWRGSADSNSHSRVELKSTRFGATLSNAGVPRLRLPGYGRLDSGLEHAEVHRLWCYQNRWAEFLPSMRSGTSGLLCVKLRRLR